MHSLHSTWIQVFARSGRGMAVAVC